MSRHLGAVFRLHFGKGFIEKFQTLVQGLGKPGFFIFNHAGDKRPRLGKLGIGRLHDVEHHGGRMMEKRFDQSDVPSIPDGPAHDPSQHIPPAVIGRQHTVTDQKRCGSTMVGNDLHGHITFPRRTEAYLRQVLGLSDNGQDQIGFKIGGHILEDRHHPFQPQAGVNARFGKGG